MVYVVAEVTCEVPYSNDTSDVECEVASIECDSNMGHEVHSTILSLSSEVKCTVAMTEDMYLPGRSPDTDATNIDGTFAVRNDTGEKLCCRSAREYEVCHRTRTCRYM